MTPLFIDLVGPSLSAIEKAWLKHPLVGGVTLFSRNFEDGEQLRRLTHSIHSVRDDMRIAVDHEGGRVQRFKRGFTPVPAMARIKDTETAFSCGVVMAYELITHGIQINFAPVLDRDNGSKVIQDRSFDGNIDNIVANASALIQGMHGLNFPSCGKHFPGHGSVVADSHFDCPIDDRHYDEVQIDMLPFKRLIEDDLLDAIMPAHVVYSHIDDKPAGYSKRWLQQKLKNELGFTGAIFSDDLSMVGASVGGDYASRAVAAYEAGCDFLLLCNAPDKTTAVLDALETVTLRESPIYQRCFATMPEQAEALYEAALARLKGKPND